MHNLSLIPDVSTLEIPMDAWTQPFWEAAAQQRLSAPRCLRCSRFRWPPGPFCPHCQSQAVEWLELKGGRVYSFTVIPQPHAAPLGDADPPATPGYRVPALIEFANADGIRLVAAIIDTPLDAIRIGAVVSVRWIQTAHATLPMFWIP